MNRKSVSSGETKDGHYERGKRLGSSLVKIGLFVLIYALLVIGVGVTLKLMDGDWLETVAVVQAVRVESSRPGVPSWSLLVDFTYEVEGQIYTKSAVEVLHRRERSEALKQQAHWQPGNRFPVYYSADNPVWFSLQSDGGFQVKLVLGMLIMPGLMGLVMIYYVWRKRNRTASST